MSVSTISGTAPGGGDGVVVVVVSGAGEPSGAGRSAVRIAIDQFCCSEAVAVFCPVVPALAGAAAPPLPERSPTLSAMSASSVIPLGCDQPVDPLRSS